MQNITVTGKKVCIIGGGSSGISAAVLFQNKGANVFLSEIGNTEKKRIEFSELDSKNINYELGKHSPEKILDSDIIIISPGIPPDISIIKEAVNKNISIYSELEAASWFCNLPIIAVTGTNGKSTTVTLLGNLFSRHGIKNIVAGNIGLSFSKALESIVDKEIVILEVSSFQLEKLFYFHPKISILLNVSHDHIDRYKDFADYIKTKINITQNQTIKDFSIINYDDEHIRKFSSNINVNVFPVSRNEKFETGVFIEDSKIIFSKNGMKEEIIHIDEISLKGEHNIYNCMAAVCAAKIYNIKNEEISETLKSFKGLEHRFEFVDSAKGVNFINDSKATNVDSVYYALSSLKDNIILLAGGRDKKGDLSPLNNLINKKVKTLVLFGEASARMKKEWNHLSPIIIADNLEEAVSEAVSFSKSGDTILLSPACSSFDMFKSFEERGEKFKNLVKKLKTNNER